MRRAFTLMELLVVVVVLPVVMVAISGVYATFLRDIPRTTRVLEENTKVLDLLEQIRRDVDGALGLPRESEGRRADERTLLIRQSDGVVRYQIEDGRIVRTLLSDATSGDDKQAVQDVNVSNPQSAIRNPQSQERLWRAPDAVITWRLWEQNGQAYAVEVHSHVQQWIAGKLCKKLANTHVFFIHGGGDPHVAQPPSAGESESPPRAGVLHGPSALAKGGELQ